MDHQRLLNRFLRYVAIDTTANPDADSYPSSPGQLTLGKLLVDELRQIGLADAEQDDHGIVMATIPATHANVAGAARRPIVALCAHLDTSPETSGKNIRPQIIDRYPGGDIHLPGDPRQVIRAAANPSLTNLVGKTIVTTDGATLLGADDKAGVAVIVELANYLVEHPEISHGPIRLCFTCDEEIGHGVDHVDLSKLGADVCYTLDGGGCDEIDVETFSADLAIVSILGVNTHPSEGKGRMINAVRIAADFLERLPSAVAPECTSGREGFLHPYQIEGGVAETKLRILLRDFDTANLAGLASLLHRAAADSESAFPGAKARVEIIKQYRNMADGLAKEPRAVAYAEMALRRLGREPRRTIIRGGTDGSRFTELGLPTPNLSTGEHNPHSPLEWACVEEMGLAVAGLVELVQVWCELPPIDESTPQPRS